MHKSRLISLITIFLICFTLPLLNVSALTFGDTTAYGTNWQNGYDIQYCNFSSPAVTGTVDNISVYFRNKVNGVQAQCAIYYADNLTLVPNGISDSINVDNEGSFSWHLFPYSDPKPTIKDTLNYVLCIGTTSSNLICKVQTTGGDSGWDRNCFYGGLIWPNPLEEDTSYTYILSIYASYTETVEAWSNTAPIFSSESPTNESTDQSRWPVLAVDVTDADGNNSEVDFYYLDGAVWYHLQHNATVLNETVRIMNFTNASSYSTTYYWKVTANDTHDNSSEVNHFTTEAEPAAAGAEQRNDRTGAIGMLAFVIFPIMYYIRKRRIQ